MLTLLEYCFLTSALCLLSKMMSRYMEGGGLHDTMASRRSVSSALPFSGHLTGLWCTKATACKICDQVFPSLARAPGVLGCTGLTLVLLSVESSEASATVSQAVQCRSNCRFSTYHLTAGSR